MRVIDIDGHVREADDLWERYSSGPLAPVPRKFNECQTANSYFCWKATATTANPMSLLSR